MFIYLLSQKFCFPSYFVSEKTKHREIQGLVLSHTAGLWEVWDLNPDIETEIMPVWHFVDPREGSKYKCQAAT